MPGQRDPDQQDDLDQDQDGDTEDEVTEEEDSSQDGDTDSDSDEDHEPEANDLRGMTQEQLLAEAVRLRRENASKRIKLRDTKKTLKELERTTQSKDAETRAKTAEARAEAAEARAAELVVSNALRDYLADAHPQHLKLARRIARFVETEGLDYDDEDSVEEAVKKAADDFIADLPPVAAGNGTGGQPIGGIGRVPGRNGSSDTAAKNRQKEAVPEAYRNF